MRDKGKIAGVVLWIGLVAGLGSAIPQQDTKVLSDNRQTTHEITNGRDVTIVSGTIETYQVPESVPEKLPTWLLLGVLSGWIGESAGIAAEKRIRKWRDPSKPAPP